MRIAEFPVFQYRLGEKVRELAALYPDKFCQLSFEDGLAVVNLLDEAPPGATIFKVVDAPTDQIEMRVGGLTVVHRSPEK